MYVKIETNIYTANPKRDVNTRAQLGSVCPCL